MAHDDGTILASELYPVAEACGQTPEQVRSCLRRLVAEGLFLRQGTGVGARFRATERGMSALGTSTERTRLAYVQDAAGRGWDRQWRLVAFAIPERHRSARDAFRDHLRLLGGAAVQGGLYVSAHPWQKDVKAEAERLGLAHLVTIAVTDDLEIGGERDPRELARGLWRIDELADRYLSFIEEFGYVPDALTEMRRQKVRLPDTTFLPGALRMAVAFGECFNDDPLLPPELLPRPWPGRAARELLLRSRRFALSIRQVHGGPLLFRDFDDAIELIP
jgi:phenylacetic acid degradation operon negative regulatory protein